MAISRTCRENFHPSARPYRASGWRPRLRFDRGHDERHELCLGELRQTKACGVELVSPYEGTEPRAVEKEQLTSQHVFAMLEQLERVGGRCSRARQHDLVDRPAVNRRFPAR